MSTPSNGRITVSEETLRAVVGELRLELVREIQGLRREFPDEDRVRIIAREELTATNTGKWSMRASLAACLLAASSILTFYLTTTTHKNAPPVPTKVTHVQASS